MENEREQDSLSTLPDQILIKSKSSSSHKDYVELPKLEAAKRVPKMSAQLKKIMKPKLLAKQKYFTQGFGITEENAINVEKEPIPYKYPKDLEQFAYKVLRKAWRTDVKKEEIKKKCADKHGFQDQQKRGLLKRLYVKEPKITTMETVLDINPQYFSIVEGNI